jgi:hypothetical protein
MSNKILTAAAAGLAALAMLVLPLMPAHADATRSTSCVGNYGSFSCVTNWRRDHKDAKDVIAKPDPQEQAESKARERRWLARCRPVVRQDVYGVLRYVYAAPGCEFGRYE